MEHWEIERLISFIYILLLRIVSEIHTELYFILRPLISTLDHLYIFFLFIARISWTFCIICNSWVHWRIAARKISSRMSIRIIKARLAIWGFKLFRCFEYTFFLEAFTFFFGFIYCSFHSSFQFFDSIIINHTLIKIIILNSIMRNLLAINLF